MLQSIEGKRMAEQRNPSLAALLAMLAVILYQLRAKDGKISSSKPGENAELELDKIHLEVDKLALEVRVLRHQTSMTGRFLGILQASAVPAALLGVLVTFIIGTNQVKETEENRTAERFDGAVTKLASDKASERLAGASGLSLFVSAGNREWNAPALQYLINAVSIETDISVQKAILDIVDGVNPADIAHGSLIQAMETAIKRNRTITSSVVMNRGKRVEKKVREFVSLRLGLKKEDLSWPLPSNVVSQLSLDDIAYLKGIYTDIYSSLESDEEIKLRGLGSAIVALQRRGANVRNMSGILCADCDFSRISDLDEHNFDGSFLKHASFAHSSLKGSSFMDADLGNASFFRLLT